MKPAELNNLRAQRNLDVVELNHIRSEIDRNAKLLADRVDKCDLSSEKELNEIARLQVRASLLPQRLALREQRFEKRETELSEAAERFRQEYLSPRIGNQLEKARLVVGKELEAIFTPGNQLRDAVEASDLVLNLKRLWLANGASDLETFGPERYANDLMETLRQSESFDSKLR